MQKTIVCPHCKKESEHEINVRSAEKDAYGFEVGSKGAGIAKFIADSGAEGISKDDLMLKCLEHYGKLSNGRVGNVISKLNSRGLLERKGNAYKMKKVAK